MVLLMNWTVFCKYSNFNFVQSCYLYIMHNCITVDEYVLEIMSTKITLHEITELTSNVIQYISYSSKHETACTM